MDKLLSLLQFSDGLFPSGGYAHSFGLETLVQNGKVKDADGVRLFLHSYLTGMAGPCDAVAVSLALEHAKKKDHIALVELDAFLHALKPVKEFRDASLQMGRQVLKTACALSDDAALHAFYEKVQKAQCHGHHTVVFGLIGSAFFWDDKDAALSYLYSTVSMLAGASMRLLPIGQMQGQKLIHSMIPVIQTLAEEAAVKTLEDMHSFAPALEIAGMEHAVLPARLFRS